MKATKTLVDHIFNAFITAFFITGLYFILLFAKADSIYYMSAAIHGYITIWWILVTYVIRLKED